MEEQKTRDTAEHKAPEQETIKGSATLHGTYLGEIALPFGAKLSDAIEEMRKLKPDLTLKGWTVTVNDHDVEVTEDGVLKENPTLLANFTLSLVQKFTGGN